MHAIHPNARTTPAVPAEIARSTEPSGVLAQRYGVSEYPWQACAERLVVYDEDSGPGRDESGKKHILGPK